MPNNSKASNHIKDLLLLFAVPIAIAVIAALVVYVPKLLANPKYDFIYTVCDSYNCKDDYTVDKTGNITVQYHTLELGYGGTASLRYYDAAHDSTKGVTLEEAKQYRLDASSKSPDGYTLTRENENGHGFLFWGNYDDNWYLKDGIKKKKVDLASESMGIKFLGWVNK